MLLQHAVHGRHRRTDRYLVKPDAKTAGEIGGVLEAFPAGVGGRHHYGVNKLRPESIDRERRDERRVDPAGKAENHTGKTVLFDIVTQSQGEPAVKRRHAFIRRRHLAGQ